MWTQPRDQSANKIVSCSKSRSKIVEYRTAEKAAEQVVLEGRQMLQNSKKEKQEDAARTADQRREIGHKIMEFNHQSTQAKLR
jgi:hypothetical protein